MTEQLEAENNPYVEVVREFRDNHPELPLYLPEIWGVVADFIFENSLTVSPSNLEFALGQCRGKIEQAINKIPSDIWKQKVVIPEWKARQAAQPKRESTIPWGVKYTEFLHNP